MLIISKSVSISHRGAMGFFICTLVVACVLWPSTASALEAPACDQASQQSAVINFFFHDDFGVEPMATAFDVVDPVSSPNGLANTNLFGRITVIDDKITVGPEANSTEIGRGRGFYVQDSLAAGTFGFEFVLTAIFNNQSGYEDGSTLVLRGNDNVLAVYRELAIVGGTGTFRLARGWAGILTYEAHGAVANLNFTSSVYYGCNYGFGSTSARTSQMVESLVSP